MSFGMAYATKKRCMAKGGSVTETASSNRQNQKGVHQSMSRGDAGTSVAGSYVKGHGYGDNPEKAKSMHREKLSEMRAMPKPKLMAKGGEVEEMGEYDPMEHPQPKENEAAMHEDADMIARILHKRKMYSKGGMVANDTPPIADSMPADFDVLATSDELEGEQPEDSNEHGDSDVSDDPIDRLMLKRKKDKLPRPA